MKKQQCPSSACVSPLVALLLLLSLHVLIPSQQHFPHSANAFPVANRIGSRRGGVRALLKPDAAFSTSRKSRSCTSLRMMFQYDPSWAEGVGSAYAYCLENYYLATQSATGAVCATLGDAIAQWSEIQEAKRPTVERTMMSSASEAASANAHSLTEYDFVRTFHYFLKGLGGGIAWSYWFDLSDPLSNSLTHSLLPGTMENSAFGDDGSSSTWAALQERATCTSINILLEQFLVSPLLFTFWDIPLPALLRGTPLRQIPNQVQSKLLPLLVANAKVWTLVNLVTYNLPVEYRVLFSSCADIVWQSINAGITSQEVPPSTPPPVLEVGFSLSSTGSLLLPEPSTSSSSSSTVWSNAKSTADSTPLRIPTNSTTMMVTSATMGAQSNDS